MKKFTFGEEDHENGVYEDILEIVCNEVSAIKTKRGTSVDDIKNLFILARIYAVLKDDLREDIKHEILDRPNKGSSEQPIKP